MASSSDQHLRTTAANYLSAHTAFIIAIEASGVGIINDPHRFAEIICGHSAAPEPELKPASRPRKSRKPGKSRKSRKSNARHAVKTHERNHIKKSQPRKLQPRETELLKNIGDDGIHVDNLVSKMTGATKASVMSTAWALRKKGLLKPAERTGPHKGMYFKVDVADIQPGS